MRNSAELDADNPSYAVSVSLTRPPAGEAPTYELMAELDPPGEQNNHEHYGRNGYRADEKTRTKEVPPFSPR